MKYYLLYFPRPIGLEPTVYLYKPDIVPTVHELEPGWFQSDPWSNPEVEEYNTIKEALSRIIEFNSSNDYLKEIGFKDEKA